MVEYCGRENFKLGVVCHCLQDSVIYERLGENQEHRDETLLHLGEFASEGKEQITSSFLPHNVNAQIFCHLELGSC